MDLSLLVSELVFIRAFFPFLNLRSLKYFFMMMHFIIESQGSQHQGKSGKVRENFFFWKVRESQGISLFF